MTTLAGCKIRAYREAQRPRMTRGAFAARYGVPSATTVQGWEHEGKRPSDNELVARLHGDGVCERGDWFLPAKCPECLRLSDSDAVTHCQIRDCPMREKFGVGGALGATDVRKAQAA